MANSQTTQGTTKTLVNPAGWASSQKRKILPALELAGLDLRSTIMLKQNRLSKINIIYSLDVNIAEFFC